jgi:ketosteroid isomerase-like protein
MLRCCVLLLAVAPALAAQAPGPEMQSLVAAERAFARASVEHGTREAFLEFLADDAVIFRPGPVEGRQWLEARPPAEGRLSWEPLFAARSRDGRFGYTTGPWQFLPPDGEPSHGHYVTVWSREPGGRWRVAADIGVSHPRPATLAGDLTFAEPRRSRPGNVRDGSSGPRGREALEVADRAYATLAAEQGSERACLEHAADSLRLYREGTTPLMGKRPACRSLADRGERIVSDPAGLAVADSRDLGFVYGTLEFAPAGEGSSPRQGSFLRVWKETADGRWRLVLDVAVPHPAPPEGS